MSVLALYRELEKRGVRMEASGGSLMVDAPAGELSAYDKVVLSEHKAALLLLLVRLRPEMPDQVESRRFDAAQSRYPGYTSLYDPVESEWHDFPTEDCHPSIVELANKKRRKGLT